MTDLFRCGDNAALVGYLYEDCEPGEREAIAAHLQGCRVCAGELDALADARRQLAGWTPPATRLGFRITSADAVSNVIPFSAAAETTSGAWWRQPLPAWAQMAAAVLIFASGMAVGAVRYDAAPAAPQATAGPDVRASVAMLERRVAGIEHARIDFDRTSAGPDVVTNEDAIVRRIRNEISNNNERERDQWRQELAARVVDLMNTQSLQVEQLETKVTGVRNEFVSGLQRVAFQR
jgi:hypothetical protein